MIPLLATVVHYMALHGAAVVPFAFRRSGKIVSFFFWDGSDNGQLWRSDTRISWVYSGWIVHLFFHFLLSAAALCIWASG